MKTICYTLIFYLILLQGVAQNRSIIFNKNNFSAIKAQAALEKKFIFIDTYATWCAPCRVMSKQVFTNDSVADFYNLHFINIKVDVEKDSLGKYLKKAFAIDRLPTFFFIDSTGNMVHKRTGLLPVNLFLTFGYEALDTLKQLSALMLNYLNGNRSKDLVINYINALKAASMDSLSQVVYLDYINNLHEEDFLTPDYFNLIKENACNIKSREFKYVLNQFNKFATLYTVDSVNFSLSLICRKNILNIIQQTNYDSVAYNKIKDEVLLTGFSQAEKLLLELDLRYYKRMGYSANYYNSACKYFDNFEIQNHELLNDMALTIYQETSNNHQLFKALSMAKHSLLINRNMYNLNTYASILFKLGEYVEALPVANEALSIAQNINDSDQISEQEELIKKINKRIKKQN